jgi:predicted SAM-dependent methyltransferase
MRINFGCGSRIWPEYFNIDAVHNPNAPSAPQLLFAFDFYPDGNLKTRLPIDDGVADELVGIHVFEHFHRWTCEAVITEWRRVLRPGGRLVLELPDLIKCCQNILEGREGRHPDQMGRWGLYGDPRDKDIYMCHPWGWAPKELMGFLREHGFKEIQHLPTKFHSVGRKHRDMRIEAIKG